MVLRRFLLKVISGYHDLKKILPVVSLILSVLYDLLILDYNVLSLFIKLMKESYVFSCIQSSLF